MSMFRPVESSSLSCKSIFHTLGFYQTPCGSDGKESACCVGDSSSIPGLVSSPGVGNGNTLQYFFFFFQYSYLENSMERRAWQATVPGVAELDTTEQLTHTIQEPAIWNVCFCSHLGLIINFFLSLVFMGKNSSLLSEEGAITFFFSP